MGGAPTPSPYSESTQVTDLPRWKKELYGFTKDAPEYSPFKALSRQASAQARMIEGMTTAPTWSAMEQAYGVPKGTDLTPYIQASRRGMPTPDAPIPQRAAQGGLMSLRKFADGGNTKPKDINKQQATWLQWANNQVTAGKPLNKQQEQKRDFLNQRRTNYTNYQNQQKADQAPAPAVPYAQAMEVKVPFYDPTQAQGQYGGVTNPIYQQALDQLRAVSQTPEQFGQATGIMSDAASQLMAQAGYTPQQIEAAKIARGDIRDVNAQMAEVERMQGGPNVRAVKSQAAQMAGPSSWTQEGTAAQYMSPYMQNVVDIQKREANRDFAKQMARLDAQAAQAGAYGGSRSAIERAEARRAQAQRLGDIEAQGLQQAYSQGMGQFSTEQGQGLQAGQANLSAAMQSILANQQAGMTAQQLNQMYGSGGFGAQQANMAAQNQAYNNFVQQQLTAQGMNQGMDWNTANQNAQMLMQSRLANQQADLTAQGLRLQALNQAGQMGQGIGALGSQMWSQQQNIPQLWGAAGQTVQGIAQQSANAAQQTAQNWYGGMGQAYQPVANLLGSTPGSSTSGTQSRIPGMG